MKYIFLEFLKMSVISSILVLVLIAFRLIFRKAPRYILCILWLLVAIRLICPISVKTSVSVIPESFSNESSVFLSMNFIESGNTNMKDEASTNLDNTIIQITKEPEQPKTDIIYVISLIWSLGVFVMLLYSVYSYLRIKKRVIICVPHSKRVYLSDGISSPFILGVFKPKIYIPSSTDQDELKYVLAHERAHIKRFDHVWKPLGYILLSLHWYNPLIWISYSLLCRDIETACDEKVIKEYCTEEKKSYSAALLNASIERKMLTTCPLAFGEIGVKARIKRVLNYKKPMFWIIILAIAAAFAIALFFVTDPIKKEEAATDVTPATDLKYFSDLKGVDAELISFGVNTNKLTVKFTSDFDKEVIFGDEFNIYYLNGEEWVNCRVTSDVSWYLIGYPLTKGNVFKHSYSLTDIDLTRAGRYKFVTDCLIHNESPDNDGKRKEYLVGFEFTLEEGFSFNRDNFYKSFNFTDSVTLKYKSSPDPYVPEIRLNKAERTFMFIWSGFSSYVAMGEYRLFIDRLELVDFSGEQKYVFYKVDNGFAFKESESSPIPDYVYAQGELPKQPVPDGAVFEWEDSTDFFSNSYDIALIDLDKDGIKENYSVTFGSTSGRSSYILNVSEGDYSTSALFFDDIYGNLRLMVTYSEGLFIGYYTGGWFVPLYDVKFDGESLALIPLDDIEQESEKPDTVKVNVAYVWEVGDRNKYIVVTEGDDGYIHTNDSNISKNKLFKFDTSNQKTIFKVGDKVKIIHSGEFTNEDIPQGNLLGLVEILQAA